MFGSLFGSLLCIRNRMHIHTWVHTDIKKPTNAPNLGSETELCKLVNKNNSQILKAQLFQQLGLFKVRSRSYQK